MILLETSGPARPIALLGYPRGHRIWWETQAGHAWNRHPKDTHPRTRASAESGTTTGRAIAGWQLFTQRSSCLRFQIAGVEADSFLPQDQDDGGDFARHGKANHLRAHALIQQSLGKLAYRPGAGATASGHALEHVLKQMMMIAIEASHGGLALA